MDRGQCTREKDTSAIFESTALTIEHKGSTAVEDLQAKSIIDIAVCITLK